MQRFGFVFLPIHEFGGWFAATEISDEAAVSAAEHIHAHAAAELGNDLLFCGGPSSQDTHARLFLVPGGDPAEAAGQLAVASQAASYDKAAPEQARNLVAAIHRIIPLSPLFINSATFDARFLVKLDETEARRVLQVAEEYDNQGMEVYAEADYEEEEQGGAVGKLVREQAIHLWWD